jgi:hypothetical protein
MYQPEFHPKVDKDLSKLDKNLRRDIRDKHIPKILHDPQRVGGNLTGKLAGLKSYSFAANRSERKCKVTSISDLGYKVKAYFPYTLQALPHI